MQILGRAHADRAHLQAGPGVTAVDLVRSGPDRQALTSPAGSEVFDSLSHVQLRPTNDFMDKFVAPEFSSFTEASIPDLSALL